MKQLLLLLGLLALLRPAAGQTFVPVPAERGQPILCPAGPPARTRVAAPANFRPGTVPRPTAANFVVTYSANFPATARAAFDYAVGIWAAQINSPVPIRVYAFWESLGPGPLGGSYPTTKFMAVNGGHRRNVLYPAPLAEKLAGRELNPTTDPDILLAFNSNQTWYLGTDANPGASQMDFVSVVLHELGHGLGFDAQFRAFPEFPATAQGIPLTLFTTHLENQAGQQLANPTLFANPSAALTAQLTSGQVYFGSPLAAAANGGQLPRIYAPRSFSDGSSLSHFDEDTYPAGNVNSLMTPFRGAGEAIHNPGPLMLNMLREMGWVGTAIRHRPLPSTETARDFPVTATIVSDGTLTPGSLLLHYQIDNATPVSLPLTATGVTNEYAASIPNPGAGKTVRYYLAAADNQTSRTYTAPAAALPGASAGQPWYEFFVGPDVVPPSIQHQAPSLLFTNQLPYTITAQAADSVGMGTVTLEYSINGTARPALPLTRQGSSSEYTTTLTTAAGPIEPGDVLTYRLVARDGASTPNQATAPASGVYTVSIVGYKTPQVSYSNNFDTPTPLDFTGNGFSVTQPAGFANSALHSTHPYGNNANFTYLLLQPIVVRATAATVSFDHIAFVGPDISNAILFGDDRVRVEGSKDDGTTWSSLGSYQSSTFSAWSTLYNPRDADNNSTGVPTESLYRRATINLRQTYAAGDVVRLRFVLSSNASIHGWGWVIDNLVIQPVASSAAGAHQGQVAAAYPNPTSGSFTLALPAGFAGGSHRAELLVRNALGQQLGRQQVVLTPDQANLHVALGTVPAGLYQVSLRTPEGKTVSGKVQVQP
ncbi:zinc-dependent metalloprotease [Hymenobacter cellulosivorans]|uniref:Zinc-dependent metalloprotease n=1 Tax=Hymenobacter cellulosivorans TaxID=2932249 RepID=A0ABY4F4Q7_9BACT|nr:zinc-dependent metalloprotease [Hymenobacter cellulosivorans]UOQ51132.1 zinc-dependent metalloprotease [Hymenobacter cellulosivorans]